MESIELKFPDGVRRQFHHRGTRADIGVIKQIFENQEYALRRLKRGVELYSNYQTLILDGKKPLFVDAGANIGASVVWFAINFPGCHIVAFEPDPENYGLLVRNTMGLDVGLHNAAVGCVDGRVSLIDPGEGEWGYRTKIEKNGTCKLISLSRLLKNKMKMGFTPFLVKIDIEGGEENLFMESTEWVNEFQILIIELHDWLMPKQGTSRSFIKCIANYERDFVYIGENIFSLKNS